MSAARVSCRLPSCLDVQPRHVACGPVAQRLEQRTHNPAVVGSNPTRTIARGPREGYRRLGSTLTFSSPPPDASQSAIGRVAQLVRALLSHSRGPGFESLRAHSTYPRKPKRARTARVGPLCISGSRGVRTRTPGREPRSCLAPRPLAGPARPLRGSAEDERSTVRRAPACRSRPMVRSSSRARITIVSSSFRWSSTSPSRWISARSRPSDAGIRISNSGRCALHCVEQPVAQRVQPARRDRRDEERAGNAGCSRAHAPRRPPPRRARRSC